MEMTIWSAGSTKIESKATLEQIERGLERLERRLWLAVCSVAMALLGQLIALIWTAPV